MIYRVSKNKTAIIIKGEIKDRHNTFYLFIYLFTHLAKNNKIITKVRHYINKIL